MINRIVEAMEYLETNEIMDYLQVIHLQIMQRYEQRFFPKGSDLLSLISFGIEFQSCALSYMKLFFILFVCGLVSKDH